MAADAGTLVSDPTLMGTDVSTTAKVLSAALGRGGFDIIIAGDQSTDGVGGMVPGNGGA